MLQQTTVRAVAPYFQRFVERWPDIGALAAAKESEVMAAWAGLGYYSRARNLIACAREVTALPDMRFPESAAKLARLPGIGAYTSAAIAAIAFDEPIAVVDGNVERVIARVFALEAAPPALKRTVRDRVQPFVPQDRPGEFAEALMDLGATICTPRKPACALCPWSEPCIARHEGRQDEFPAKPARRLRPVRNGIAFVARRRDGAILLRRRPPRGLLGGMAEVPGTEWSSVPKPVVERPIAAKWTKIAAPVDHVFTHFALRLGVERAEIAQETAAPPGAWWAAADSLHKEALPSVMKKVIEAAYPGATKPRNENRMNEIRHIVLDVGNVLVHYDPHLAYTELIPDRTEREAFLRDVCSHEWNIEQDRGRAWAEAEAEAIGRHPDKAELIRAFRRNWRLMISHAYEETVSVLRALLAQGRDVTMLTNFAADTFKEARERFPFLNECRGVTVSAEVRLLKPNPEIYAHHAAAFGLNPAATLFFDDSERNVEGARKAGWQAERFQTAPRMRADLARYGIAI
jgi:A/G-specific adenine glycosylase